MVRPHVEKYWNIKLVTTADRRSLHLAWNMGWVVAEADIVCYSNMDEALHRCCLGYVADYMENRKSVDLCTVMITCQ